VHLAPAQSAEILTRCQNFINFELVRKVFAVALSLPLSTCLQLIMISAQQGMTYGYLVIQNSLAQPKYFTGQKNYVTLH